MPRFVVLRHELPSSAGRPSHWDFMLEHDGVLRTWALYEVPDHPEPQTADALADHRLAYLEYEGEVSGGRGSVARWDAGTYEALEPSRAASGVISVRLAGRLLRGIVRLAELPEAAGRSYTYEAD